MRSDTSTPITDAQLSVYAEHGSHADIRAMATELLASRAARSAGPALSEGERESLRHLRKFAENLKRLSPFFGDDDSKETAAIAVLDRLLSGQAAPAVPQSLAFVLDQWCAWADENLVTEEGGDRKSGPDHALITEWTKCKPAAMGAASPSS